ncbi:MAG TPA: hypothetical protein VF813_02450 [Anaerolineaceae bacterium]
MTAPYRQTQISFLMVGLLVLFLFTAIAVILGTRFTWEAVLVYFLLALIMVNFMTLTVAVLPEQVELQFGPGLLRKKIALEDLLNLCVKDSLPGSGWGFRLSNLTWIYNLTGRQHVEVDLRDESRVLIASDQPVELAREIEKALIASRKK